MERAAGPVTGSAGFSSGSGSSSGTAQASAGTVSASVSARLPHSSSSQPASNSASARAAGRAGGWSAPAAAAGSSSVFRSWLSRKLSTTPILTTWSPTRSKTFSASARATPTAMSTPARPTVTASSARLCRDRPDGGNCSANRRSTAATSTPPRSSRPVAVVSTRFPVSSAIVVATATTPRTASRSIRPPPSAPTGAQLRGGPAQCPPPVPRRYLLAPPARCTFRSPSAVRSADRPLR